MTKITKMSLVAAMAVAGFTSANAGSLEEAIKDVQISGFVEYRAEKGLTNYNKADSEMQHDLDIRLQAVVPINDMMSATVRFDEGSDEDKDKTLKLVDTDKVLRPNDKEEVVSEASLDSNAQTLEVDRAFFTYNNDGLKANFGLIGTPLTEGHAADGVSVSKNLGVVSVGAGYLYTNAVTKADEVAFLTASGSAEMVKYALVVASVLDSDSPLDANQKTQNVNGTDLDNKRTAVHAMVGADFDVDGIKLSVGADYSLMNGFGENNDVTAPDQSQYKLSFGADAGMVSASIAYAQNGEDGGLTMIDGSDVAGSNISLGALALQKEGKDVSAILASVTGNIDAKNLVKVRFAKSSNKIAKSDVTVTRLNFVHKMSSNFNLYAEYTMNSNEANDKAGFNKDASDMVLGAKYTF